MRGPWEIRGKRTRRPVALCILIHEDVRHCLNEHLLAGLRTSGSMIGGAFPETLLQWLSTAVCLDRPLLYPVTAAGPFRIYTGFPIKLLHPRGRRNTSTHRILRFYDLVNPRYCGFRNDVPRGGPCYNPGRTRSTRSHPGLKAITSAANKALTPKNMGYRMMTKSPPSAGNRHERLSSSNPHAQRLQATGCSRCASRPRIFTACFC